MSWLGSMGERRKQLLLGLLGGAVSATLTLWFRFYIPETDSFADIRDAPSILLGLFCGPIPALIAGAIAACARAAVGLFSGSGSATWFASSLATFCAALVAIAARRFVFLGQRPSFALGAVVAVMVEMMHMVVVLAVGSAESSNAFAVVAAAIPFQCGGAAVAVAVASLLLNRRQNGRENLAVAVLASTIVTFVTLVYFAMKRQAEAIAGGNIPVTDNLCLYPCHLATVLYGIVLSVLAFAFAAYAKRRMAANPEPDAPSAASGSRFRVGLRGRFAISLAVMLGVIGGLIGLVVAIDSRSQYEISYSESTMAVVDFLSKSIDGDRTRAYCETRQKDAYYEDVRRMLVNMLDATCVQYLFVIVPDEKGGTYVWDTDNSTPSGLPQDLGTREEAFNEDEIENFCGVFRQKYETCCFIHRSPKYGHLMSVAVPILGSDGVPAAIVCADVPMDYVDKQISQIVLGIVLITLTLVLLCLAAYYFFVSRFIVSPAERQIEAEQDRIHAELNVARKIQADTLPNVFPAFPDRRDFDIYAMMAPVKEVGGDFYDFFLVDDSHLALVIGDVSDKGVPAALFMMTTKTLVNARARQGGTPAEILHDVNDQLHQGNASNMFVTVYLAILDLATGECLAANAGHEHPAIRRKGAAFGLVKYAHDPMLGIIPSVAYSDRSFRLSPGDTLLVYTDGVPEAKDPQGRMFGADRLVDALNRITGADPRSLLTGLRDEIHAFVGTAPQFDDLTLLAVTYKGGEG